MFSKFYFLSYISYNITLQTLVDLSNPTVQWCAVHAQIFGTGELRAPHATRLKIVFVRVLSFFFLSFFLLLLTLLCSLIQ